MNADILLGSTLFFFKISGSLKMETIIAVMDELVAKGLCDSILTDGGGNRV